MEVNGCMVIIRSNSSIAPRLYRHCNVIHIPVRIAVNSRAIRSNSVSPLRVCSHYGRFNMVPGADNYTPTSFTRICSHVRTRRPSTAVLRLTCSRTAAYSRRSSGVTTGNHSCICSVSAHFISINRSLIIIRATGCVRTRPSTAISRVFTFAGSIVSHILLNFIPASLTFLGTNNHLSGITFLNTRLLGVGPYVRIANNGFITAGGFHNSVLGYTHTFVSRVITGNRVSCSRVNLTCSINLSRRLHSSVRICTRSLNFGSIA